MRTGDHKQVGVRLKAGRHGPFDLVRIVDIDVEVDHDDLLDVIVSAESAHDDVPGFSVAALVDFDDKVIAAGPATGQPHIPPGGETSLKILEHSLFPGKFPQHQMFHAPAYDGVKERIPALRHRPLMDGFTT